MKKLVLSWFLVVLVNGLPAQPVQNRLQQAWRRFMADSQLRYALASLCVAEAGSGKIIFEDNSRVGLAPASTQKVITSVTALDLLGPGFGYQTFIYLDGPVTGDTLLGNLVIRASGDPTFGSDRFAETKRAVILEALHRLLRDARVRYVEGDLVVDDRAFPAAATPDGWIWQDIGNYYGAGASALNWNENLYELYLRPGEKEGAPATVIKTEPAMKNVQFFSELRTGPRGSGDNAYIYLPPAGKEAVVRGTIPLGENPFRIRGSLPDPAMQFLDELRASLVSNGTGIGGANLTGRERERKQGAWMYGEKAVSFFVSPSLEKIIYFFNRNSINLYGESLLKTIALQQSGKGTSDEGLRLLRQFWKERGLDPEQLNMYDGSGLSPLNRVTTRAQVEVLRYARTRSWFPGFLEALPLYNGMKMKSGTISDVKGFCGFHRSKDGTEYVFSLLVNNYSGRTSSVVNKMYKVLDELK